MINFAEKLKPHVVPAIPERFVVKGIQTHCVTDEKKAVRCVCEIKDNRAVYIVEGGVTGHESFLIEDRVRHPDNTAWCACAGTAHRWHALDIDGENMAALMKWVRGKVVTF